MPSTNKVTIDPTLSDAIKSIAAAGDLSFSDAVNRIIREALDLHEDIILESIAKSREKTFKGNALSHEETWE